MRRLVCKTFTLKLIICTLTVAKTLSRMKGSFPRYELRSSALLSQIISSLKLT